VEIISRNIPHFRYGREDSHKGYPSWSHTTWCYLQWTGVGYPNTGHNSGSSQAALALNSPENSLTRDTEQFRVPWPSRKMRCQDTISVQQIFLLLRLLHRRPSRIIDEVMRRLRQEASHVPWPAGCRYFVICLLIAILHVWCFDIYCIGLCSLLFAGK
jgi:hypothetical protein